MRELIEVKPLTYIQKTINSMIGKSRCVIGCTFGSMELSSGGGPLRKGMVKAHDQHILESMAHDV